MITFITGPMYAGKSEELLRRINRFVYAEKEIIAFKSSRDTRDKKEIKSRYILEGFPATLIQDSKLDSILGISEKYDVVFFDEIHFFPEIIISIIDELANQGKEIIISGLDMDYLRKPFLISAKLLAMSEKVIKLSGVCHRCKKNSLYTQLIINNEPILTSEKGNIVVDDGSVIYETRCRKCFGKK